MTNDSLTRSGGTRMTSDSSTRSGGTMKSRLPVRLAGKLGRLRLALGLIAGLAVFGCTQGSYPVDIFYEMHYQQSYKSHEPPRLSAPESSVAFFEGPKSTLRGPESNLFDTGQHLFAVNCSMCHGLDAKGTGSVLRTLMDSYGYEPVVTPDLTTLPDGSIEPFLIATSRPFGPDSVMPPFGKLLSAQERRAISDYIATLPK